MFNFLGGPTDRAGELFNFLGGPTDRAGELFNFFVHPLSKLCVSDAHLCVRESLMVIKLMHYILSYETVEFIKCIWKVNNS